MVGTQDRRHEPRFDVRIPATAELLPDSELDGHPQTLPSAQQRPAARSDRAQSIRVVIRNLSLQGAFVATDAPPPLRSTVRLAFELDGADITVTGLVVWRRTQSGARGLPGKPAPLEAGFGVLFDCMSPTIKAFLERQLLPRPR